MCETLSLTIREVHVTLGSTQPLTEMSTRNLPGGAKVRPARKADNLTAICEPTL
jgi:hypothetical protein